MPELKGRKIRIDSLELSKEGMAALRGRVQSMPGRIDMEEMMQMREILPKLKLNPEDDFYWAMREDMQNSLDAIKQSKGNYTLDDLISSGWMHTPDSITLCKSRMRMTVGIFTYAMVPMRRESYSTIRYQREKT